MEKLEARFYRSLYRIRRVEEEVARVYPTDKIKSPVHLSIGQEAVSVGVCEALQKEDVVFGTYRGHAFYLAKGGDLRRMAAELYGKATGCTKGKGGSMHLVDVSVGVMGASAVVATTIPQAVGYAFAMKVRKENRVVVSFFGDGAIEEGAFHESANFAALRQIPVIFICENNLYAVHTPIRDRQPPVPIYRRLEGYGIPAERIENNNVDKLYERVKAAADEMRRTHSGPRFFECMTYRWKEHVGPNEDFQAGYRGRNEAEPWFENDPVRRMGEKLEAGVRKEIERKVDSEIREAFDFAEQSPFPSDEQLYTDLLAGA
ncbi:MAG: thiamine pyrophosphate-dependent dehydrogenase E1 component subunit alpha [Nitrospirae bacterium]|nr:thiamine pyrophosphate-dependent dehydrogenase E1 component subunit alpha [Nitrospirota bacterium]